MTFPALQALTMFRRRKFLPLDQRGPLRVMFLLTSMPVGGAETLLVNLIRGLDKTKFAPEICCLKHPGPLGEEMALELPLHHGLLNSKYDLRVLGRLKRLFRAREIDAVVTVGAGDKMFWGRLAARRAGVPVIASALHSTGWPDVIGRLNRMLTRSTDAFIGVAREHGRFLVEEEKFPTEKVHVIPNGVDTNRFRPMPEEGTSIRQQLGISPDAPVVGIVAALRHEKNHELLLAAMKRILELRPDAHLLIVGDGVQRPMLEKLTDELGIRQSVHFLGTRKDVPAVLASVDVFALCSHMEASPVSILEAMSTETPVVATRVGSIPESVNEGVTGLLIDRGSEEQLAGKVLELFNDPARCQQMGITARDVVVKNWSLEAMVRGYEELLAGIYRRKMG